jgi:hypothetical protein
LCALAPIALVLLVGVAPAVTPRAGTHRPHRDPTSIRDVASSLGGYAAGVSERVPIPNFGPVHGSAITGFAATMSLSWVALWLAAAIMLGHVGLTRRDRAPPPGYRVLPV